MFRSFAQPAFAIVLVACSFWAAPAVAQGTVNAWAELERVEAEQDAEVAHFESALRDYAGLTARIEELKQSTRVFWDAAELDELLRQQEAAAESLMAQDREIQALRAERESRAAAVADELRAEVRVLEGRFAQASSFDRTRIATELNEIGREIGRLGEPLPEHAPVPLEAITAATEDSPDELYAASDELADQELRLERELGDVRVRLADALASARVLRSESEFSSIEALLEDDGSRRLGSRGTNPDRVGAPALQDDGGAAAGGQDDFGNLTEATGTRGEHAAPESSAGAPEEGPRFDESDSDGVFSGGATQHPAEFGAAPLEPGPPEASLVDVEGPARDPDRIEDPLRRRSGRRGSPVDVLADREASLLRELESVRSERERLLERARELDGL